MNTFYRFTKGSRGGRRESGLRSQCVYGWFGIPIVCLKKDEKALVSRVSLIYLILDLSYLKYPEFFLEIFHIPVRPMD